MTRKPRSRVLDASPSIDRDSFEPAYIQLVNILRQGIAAGLLRPGEQLPSEAQLCRRFGVSPMTVRRAINILADQDVVNPQQGRGTYVKPLHLGAATFNLTGFPGLSASTSQTVVRLLEVRVNKASELVARKLAVDAGSRVIEMRRLLIEAERPVFVHRGYLVYDPGRPIVEAEMEVTTLQALFSGSGSNLIKRGELSIEPTILPAEDARLLLATPGAPGFCLEHLFFDFQECPLSWGWFVGAADRVRLTTQVGLPATPAATEERRHDALA